MNLKATIKQMIKYYEQTVRITANYSMREILNKIIEDLNTLLSIIEAKEN